MTVPGVPTDITSGTSGSRSSAIGLVLSLRPGQWTKNLLVLAPLIFGLKLFDPVAVLRACAGFAIFCALSSRSEEQHV